MVLVPKWTSPTSTMSNTLSNRWKALGSMLVVHVDEASWHSDWLLYVHSHLRVLLVYGSTAHLQGLIKTEKCLYVCLSVCTVCCRSIPVSRPGPHRSQKHVSHLSDHHGELFWVLWMWYLGVVKWSFLCAFYSCSLLRSWWQGTLTIFHWTSREYIPPLLPSSQLTTSTKTERAWVVSSGAPLWMRGERKWRESWYQ